MTRLATILCLLCVLSPAHARAGEMIASWYGSESGNRTASGAIFRPLGMSCAMWAVPFGTVMRVSYRGRAMLCTVNDRGPAKWTGRGIDLSLGMARAIGLEHRGVDRVQVEQVR